MTKKAFRKHLRRLVYILLVTTIVFMCVVHMKFNMTGSWLVPVPVSVVFEHLKAFLRGSRGNMPNIAHTVAVNRSLLNVFEGLRIQSKMVNSTAQRVATNRPNVTLYIPWYNKPNWINIIVANRFLSSSVCTYKNCKMTSGMQNLKQHAAIIFSLPDELDFKPPITYKERPHDQVWIFFGLEPPGMHTRIAYRHEYWRNTMNWSMSYRLDADIFFPYGMLERRKVQRSKNYSEIFSRKTKQAAWLVSNCGAASYRDEFVSELQRFGLNVHIFGACANDAFRNRAEMISLIQKDYKFYFSFENSFCKDYVTEKFFRYFNLDVILVVRGGADYDRILPNDTFINTGHFNAAEEVSNFLLKVSSSEHLYTNILRNKDRYVAKEMFDMPSSYCSLCEKLNNVDGNRKTYEDHVTFMHQNTCWAATDVPIKLSPSLIKDNLLTFICLFVLTIYFILLTHAFCKKKRKYFFCR